MAAQKPRGLRLSYARLHSARATVGITPHPGTLPLARQLFKTKLKTPVVPSATRGIDRRRVAIAIGCRLARMSPTQSCTHGHVNLFLTKK